MLKSGDHTGSLRNKNGIPIEFFTSKILAPIELINNEGILITKTIQGSQYYEELVLGIGGPSVGQGAGDTLSIQTAQTIENKKGELCEVL